MELRSDGDLVAAALAGDRSAFAELVLRHWPIALKVTARVTADGELARDAVQEAVVVAMISLDRLAHPDRFGAWLCGIALNVARSWDRRRLPEAAVNSELASDGTGPELAAEQADIAALVRRAIRELAPGQRDAALLFYLEGLSQREVADELRISVGAVKARLHQARAALAIRLSPLSEQTEVPAMSEASETAWVEMSVAEVRRGEGADAFDRPHVVILRERGGARELPIWVGAPEAIAMAITLESQQMPRPMTYQFAADVLDAVQARVVSVRITTLFENTFYAVVEIDGAAGKQEVDARPSDALNLALIAAAPIVVDARVLDSSDAICQTRWRDYASGAADMVREVLNRQETMMARLAEERSAADTPPGE